MNSTLRAPKIQNKERKREHRLQYSSFRVAMVGCNIQPLCDYLSGRFPECKRYPFDVLDPYLTSPPKKEYFDDSFIAYAIVDEENNPTCDPSIASSNNRTCLELFGLELPSRAKHFLLEDWIDSFQFLSGRLYSDNIQCFIMTFNFASRESFDLLPHIHQSYLKCFERRGEFHAVGWSGWGFMLIGYDSEQDVIERVSEREVLAFASSIEAPYFNLSECHLSSPDILLAIMNRSIEASRARNSNGGPRWETHEKKRSEFTAWCSIM